MSQKTTSSPEIKSATSSKASSSPISKSTLVNASGKAIRSSSSSSSGNNTRISNAYSSDKAKAKNRSNSGQDKSVTDDGSNISTSPMLSKTPHQPSTGPSNVSQTNDPNNPEHQKNTNGVVIPKEGKQPKPPRKISNIETSKTERISDQSLKRANSYASSCKTTNSKSSPSNIADVHTSKTTTQTGKNDKMDLKSSPASKGSRIRSSVRDSGFIDGNKETLNGTGDEDKPTSPLQRPASFHGSGKKQAPNTNTSPSKSKAQVISNERRKSCIGGVTEISTADLFSDHRDDSGFPRLSWKGEHSNPDLNDEGKQKIFIYSYLSPFCRHLVLLVSNII